MRQNETGRASLFYPSLIFAKLALYNGEKENIIKVKEMHRDCKREEANGCKSNV